MKNGDTLFVDEEVPEDVPQAVPESVAVDSDAADEKTTAPNGHGGIETSDGEKGPSESESESESEEDPVVESMPVYMNQVERTRQTVHLLQYQGKPKSTGKLQHIRAGVKPQSGFVRVQLPLDTTRFYDESKTDEWGVEVADHSHTGVLNKSQGGLYAAKFVASEAGDDKRVVLVPVDSTAQLRPSFKYLDDIDTARAKRDVVEPLATTSNRSGSQNVHILQSNAKNTKTTTNDPLTTGALGESLKHVRRFEQELWSEVNWNDPETLESQLLYDSVTRVPGTELHTEDSIGDYLAHLTRH